MLKFSQFLRMKKTNSERTIGTKERIGYGGFINGFSHVSGRESGMPDLKEIMEALRDPNAYMIGVCGKAHNHMSNLFDTIIRRVTREDLFGVTVMVSIMDEPDLTIIQQEIAHQLGFSCQVQEKRTPSCCAFPSKNKKAIITENAKQLYDRIRTQPKILFILRDLHTKLDLAKLGIPFGLDHNGCKLILTSQSEDILSNQMNVQRIYKNVAGLVLEKAQIHMFIFFGISYKTFSSIQDHLSLIMIKIIWLLC